MLTEQQLVEMQRLLDKQAITEVLHRYSRGIDRADKSTLASAYWSDAEDDHILYTGGGEELLKYLLSAVDRMRTAHRISNILIEFQDDCRAHCESYVWAYHNMAGEGGREDVVFGGRYLDRFERRDDEWRIARRRLVLDYFQRGAAASDLGLFGALAVTGCHYPGDPLYDSMKA